MQHKARVQCVIAATNREDPNKGIRYAFSAGIISVIDPCFDDVAARTRSLCQLLAMSLTGTWTYLARR